MFGLPAAATAATSCRPCAASIANGFSQAIILPAAAAAWAISRCTLLGAQMSTRSMSGRCTTRRQSVSVSCHPQLAANASSWSGWRALAAFITGSYSRSKKLPTLR